MDEEGRNGRNLNGFTFNQNWNNNNRKYKNGRNYIHWYTKLVVRRKKEKNGKRCI